MISSMFSLDHRLAELRPSADEHRIARQLRDAAGAPRDAASVARRAIARGTGQNRLTRATAG